MLRQDLELTRRRGSRRRSLVIVAFLGLAALGAATLSATPVSTQDDFAHLRKALIEEVVENFRDGEYYIGRVAADARILDAMGRVPRHEFVPAPLAPYAYLNRPLPVGHGQTESQPYIVALMTELAAVDARSDVLLVGIGGGYHAAILAELARSVQVIELNEEVEKAASERLRRFGYGQVKTRIGDPYFGWLGATTKFDAIIVRHAMDDVPAVLVRQLKPGGKLVIPVGRSPDSQDLILVEKAQDGTLKERRIMPVRFNRLPGGERI